MKAISSLPLGIDIGETRIRVASMICEPPGRYRLVAVASRDFEGADRERDELVPLLVEELVRELRSRSKTCVLAVAPSCGTVTNVRFPRMSWVERRRAAAFESVRLAPWDVKVVPTLVRVRSADRAKSEYAVGIVKRDAVNACRIVAQRARLRLTRLDTAALAFKRAFPFADAVVDIARSHSVVHAFGPRGAVSLDLDRGGSTITKCIETELKIPSGLAEKRKRVLGTAGAGDAARGELTDTIASAVERLRSYVPIRRIALVGNGSRLPGIDSLLESASGCLVELAVSDLLQNGDYPDDVLRAAAPDWTLAAALAAWSDR